MFATDDTPPNTGWTPFQAGDASRPTVATTLKLGKPAAAPAPSDAGSTTTAGSGGTGAGGSSAASGGFKKKKPPPPTTKRPNVSVWHVSGCANEIVNGRYIEAGRADGIAKFQNSEGVTLFRTALRETPELNITMLTCNDGESPARAFALAQEQIEGGGGDGGGGAPGEQLDAFELEQAATNRARALAAAEQAAEARRSGKPQIGDELDATAKDEVPASAAGDDFRPLAKLGLRLVTLGLRDQVRK